MLNQKVDGGSAWCTKAELGYPAASEQTKEALYAEYALQRARSSQENDELLCEGRQRPYPQRRHDSRNNVWIWTCRSRHFQSRGLRRWEFHCLDLRSSASTRSHSEGGTSSLTTASAQNFFPSNRKNSVLLAREWIHGPANAHTNQQKKKQRPDDVLDAFVRPAAAQESKRDGDEQREKRHRLKMAQMEIRRRDHAFRPRAAS